jgi:hypothetical protein
LLTQEQLAKNGSFKENIISIPLFFNELICITRQSNSKPSTMSDPFYPVLVDCVFAAQGLIFAGNGALVSEFAPSWPQGSLRRVGRLTVQMTMMPEKSTLPGSPKLDASDDVNRAFGYVPSIQDPVEKC